MRAKHGQATFCQMLVPGWTTGCCERKDQPVWKSNYSEKLPWIHHNHSTHDTNCSVSIFFEMFSPCRQTLQVEVACRPTPDMPCETTSNWLLIAPVYLLLLRWDTSARRRCGLVQLLIFVWYRLCHCFSNRPTRHNSRRTVSPTNVAHSGTKHGTLYTPSTCITALDLIE